MISDQALEETLGISGGLFPAAPRRTGKSTFVRQDLLPELSERGLLVIYEDLWADKAMDPVLHLSEQGSYRIGMFPELIWVAKRPSPPDAEVTQALEEDMAHESPRT